MTATASGFDSTTSHQFLEECVMRTCIICHKVVHRHCRFLAQNTTVKGKTVWQFAHSHCFEQQVLQPGRDMLALIINIGKQPIGRKP